MKKGTILLLFVLLTLTIITGCKKLDVTKDIEFTVEFTANSETADYSDEVLLDAAAASSVINDYADKITKIEVVSATVYLTYFMGPSGQKIVSETLSVADENGNGEEVITVITDVDLQSLASNPMPLTLDQAGVDRLAKLIKDNPHKALIKNYGSASSAPISFISMVKIKVKMTANPL